MKNQAGKKTTFSVISLFLVVIWLVPIIITVLISFKSMDVISTSNSWFALPESFHFNNYIKAWQEGNMSRYSLNSFIITSVSVIGTLFLSSLSAFALSWYKFKLQKFFLIMFIAGMLIPVQMVIIPVFNLYNKTGLYNTYLGIIMVNLAFQLGFCTFFLRNFMITIPKSLFEAGKIDGASDFTIYWKIMMPLISPALAALGILQFTWIWNDYLWSLVLVQSDNLKPVTLGLANLQGKWVTDWTIVASGSIIAALVPIVIFLLFQKYFIDGLTVGSVKG
ncbi:MAG: carbohydrate ABC transporter permease [Thermotogota bacterium]|nr:carbohydrate ABC transporter permease [Thermotogota bacterium]